MNHRQRCLILAAVASAVLALPSGAAAAPARCKGTTASKHHNAKPTRGCRARTQAQRPKARGTDPEHVAPAAIEGTWWTAPYASGVLEI